MNRKDFRKRGIMGIGTTAVAPTTYPIINPSLYVMSDITGDRTGGIYESYHYGSEYQYL